MEIEISINDTTRKVYFESVFLKHPDLESAIIADFKRYKECGELPSYFGTDVSYTQPPAALTSGIMHIHLKFPPDKFPENLPQSDRKCKMADPKNDAALVYVQGELYENRYSLLAIFNPDAHEVARNRQVMSYLCRVAQDFRDNN